jgi:hypothetical protein
MNNTAAITDFFNEKGDLFTPALASAWLRPDRVELSNGTLKFWSTRPYWTGKKADQWIKPRPHLLESFLSLADDRNTMLSDLMRGFSRKRASDQKIYQFAARFGGLQIFYQFGGHAKWPATVHIEYCDVWRYFVRAISALLRIAAEFYKGRSGSKEDWYLISTLPQVMRATAHNTNPDFLNPFAQGDEENWLALAHFVGKDSQQTRVMFSHLVNTLLGLGRARPWVTWPDAPRRDVRPQIAYTGPSLLSNLALQLWLLISKVDAFVVCTHCKKQYSPQVRAPKAGQRNFCHECRKEGVPKKYALSDFRGRQRRLRDVCVRTE